MRLWKVLGEISEMQDKDDILIFQIGINAD